VIHGHLLLRRASLVLAAVLAAVPLVLSGATVALGATPTPPAGGDPRSPGEGPGLVGDPVLAVALVAAIALASIVGTLVYIRLTERR
jgi:hypothetical protein